MKKTFKIIGIILLTLICLFLVFICEESIRLKNKAEALPLITLDKTKYCVSCLEPGDEIEMEYYSFGYKTKIRYYLSEDSSNDNKIIQINGKEFFLFNKIRLWSWIS